MILIGRNLSPFVRRCAASLNLLGLPYTQRPLSTVADAEAIRALNPLGRVPALVLEDGEVLVDSAAILDALDEMAPDRALIPREGAARREVLRALALAAGATEKLVATYYESRRPAEWHWPDNQARLASQAQAGFAALDRLAESGAWLCGEAMTQADVTAVAGFDFAATVLPDMIAGRFPALAALRDRANAIPAIGATRWVS
ncbi:glutathione S-transferase family protein [Roseomonas sp. F4]